MDERALARAAVQCGLLTERQLRECQEFAAGGRSLLSVLMDLGYVRAADLEGIVLARYPTVRIPRPSRAWAWAAGLAFAAPVATLIAGMTLGLSMRPAAGEPRPAAAAAILPDVSPPRAALFQDSFAANPETSGRWTIKRWRLDAWTRGPAEDDPSAPYHDAAGYYLTRGRSYCGMTMFAKTPLTGNRWTARFRYRVSAEERLANGFVFCFYKDPPAHHEAATGSHLAFEGTPGYGVFFDTWAGGAAGARSVSIVKDSVTRPLAKVADPRVGDQRWHAVEIRFREGQVTVLIDGGTVLTHRLENVDTSRTGFGFTAAVGAALTDHAIDDFELAR